MADFDNLTGSDSEVIQGALDMAKSQTANFSLIGRDGRVATTYARYEVWEHSQNTYQPKYTPGVSVVRFFGTNGSLN